MAKITDLAMSDAAMMIGVGILCCCCLLINPLYCSIQVLNADSIDIDILLR